MLLYSVCAFRWCRHPRNRGARASCPRKKLLPALKRTFSTGETPVLYSTSRISRVPPDGALLGNFRLTCYRAFGRLPSTSAKGDRHGSGGCRSIPRGCGQARHSLRVAGPRRTDAARPASPDHALGPGTPGTQRRQDDNESLYACPLPRSVGCSQPGGPALSRTVLC